MDNQKRDKNGRFIKENIPLNKGLNSENKNKTYEEIYGEEKAKIKKEKMSKSMKKFCNENKELIEEIAKKRSRNNKGRHYSPQSEFKKGDLRISGENNFNWIGGKTIHFCKWCNREFEDYTSNKTFFCSKECVDKSHIGRIGFWKGKHRSEETKNKLREKIRVISTERWKDPIYKEKTIKASLKGLIKRPTSYEKKIAELCIENSLPFVYTGNGTFLINFKNPDFVNEKDKVVIEVFYSWFKIRDYGSVENYKEYCKKKYNPAGWKVIFIDENEVNVDNWKELCLNKIKEINSEI